VPLRAVILTINSEEIDKFVNSKTDKIRRRAYFCSLTDRNGIDFVELRMKNVHAAVHVTFGLFWKQLAHFVFSVKQLSPLFNYSFWTVFTFGGSGPAITAHGSLDLKQDIQIHVQILTLIFCQSLHFQFSIHKMLGVFFFGNKQTKYLTSYASFDET
jgi:hypothetical protein